MSPSDTSADSQGVPSKLDLSRRQLRATQDEAQARAERILELLRARWLEGDEPALPG